MKSRKTKEDALPDKKTLLKALGIVVALAAGGLIIYASAMATFGFYNSPQYMIEPFVFGVFGLFFTYLLYLVSKIKNNQFTKGVRAVSIFGLGGVAILLLFVSANMVSRGIASNNQETADSSCSLDVKRKISLALVATIPIATDLGTGTGFYASADAKIITAFHVIDGAREVYINTVEGKTQLKVIDTAPDYDLALLQPVNPVEHVDHLRLYSNYQVGDDVIAVGFPANALTAGHASVSKGIVSRVLDFESLKLNEISAAPSNLEIVQTDAAVNPGSSGGALINECGVIGVISFKSDNNQLQDYGIVSEEGISFTVSSKSVAARFSLPIYDH